MWRRRLTVFYVVLLRVAHEEHHVHNFEFEVTDYTCPVENTFSVHVTVKTTQNIVEIPAVQELVI